MIFFCLLSSYLHRKVFWSKLNVSNKVFKNYFPFPPTGYTYVKGQSPGLDRALRQELAAFSNDLRRNSGTDRGAGQVSLEFYQKKKRWIGQEDIPWEVWTVRCELVHLVNEQERLRLQEKVGEMLSDKVSKY